MPTYTPMSREVARAIVSLAREGYNIDRLAYALTELSDRSEWVYGEIPGDIHGISAWMTPTGRIQAVQVWYKAPCTAEHTYGFAVAGAIHVFPRPQPAHRWGAASLLAVVCPERFPTTTEDML